MKKKKNFEYYLIVFLFTILIVVCFLQVLFRFVFNLPLAWTEELSRYVFIILIYCGASAAVLDNAHVRVELIDNVLSERGRFALDIAVKLLSAWSSPTTPDRSFIMPAFPNSCPPLSEFLWQACMHWLLSCSA